MLQFHQYMGAMYRARVPAVPAMDIALHFAGDMFIVQ
jgi:hypothetical protein